MTKIPSCDVTCDQLASWGFPVERTEKIVGSTTVVAPGLTFGKAVHAAWMAGHVNIKTMAPPKGGHKNTFASKKSRTESFAWAEANVRPQDRRDRSAA